MIDEKKLIKYLKSEANMDRSRAYGEHECDLIEGTIRMCIDVVKAQPKVGEWIPCSERLPEKPKREWVAYLVADEYLYDPYTAYWNGERWETEMDEPLPFITAWMPLPPAYRGE